MLPKSLSLLTGPLMTGRAKKSQRGVWGCVPGHRRRGGAVGASRGMEAGNRAVEDFAGWELRDPLGRRVGRVSRVFSDPSGRAVQVEVSMGPLGLRKVLLPVNGVRVDRKDRALLLGRAHGRSAPAGPGRQGL
ncbi:MAG TPA: hypothetical protein VGV91_20085 [Rubrobacter sp.]|nr:hypothetical protein [Rubrobacter sp.]